MNTAFLTREIREIWDPPKRAPMLVKSNHICEAARYTRGCRLWHIHPPLFNQLARHSNCIIRNRFSKCISIVPICSAQQGHLSYDVAVHHAQTLLGWEGLCMSISHLWEEAKSPHRTAESSVTIRHPGMAQPSLIYPKFAGTQGALVFLFIVLRNVFNWHACRSAVYIPKHVAHTGRWKFQLILCFVGLNKCSLSASRELSVNRTTSSSRTRSPETAFYSFTFPEGHLWASNI